MKLKESLELVLNREAELQQKYENLKKEFKRQITQYEKEIVSTKQTLKDQL